MNYVALEEKKLLPPGKKQRCKQINYCSDVLIYLTEGKLIYLSGKFASWEKLGYKSERIITIGSWGRWMGACRKFCVSSQGRRKFIWKCREWCWEISKKKAEKKWSNWGNENIHSKINKFNTAIGAEQGFSVICYLNFIGTYLL